MLWPHSENFDVVYGLLRDQHVPTGSSRLFQLQPSSGGVLDLLSASSAEELVRITSCSFQGQDNISLLELSWP